MHGHQADAVAALFENRRLGGLAGRRRPQLVDEAAERDAAARLMLARELGDVEHVGERLLARRPQDEADVRARLGEQPADRVGDRTVVARRGAAAAAGAARRRSASGARSARRSAPAPGRELPPSSFGIAERMERAEAMPELEQMLVVDREQRALQRREHRQLVVGPLDGGQRRADRSRPPRGRETPCRRRAGAECRAPRSRRRSGRVTSSPKLTKRRNSTAMWRGCSGTRRSAPSGLPLARPSSRSSRRSATR